MTNETTPEQIARAPKAAYGSSVDLHCPYCEAQLRKCLNLEGHNICPVCFTVFSETPVQATLTQPTDPNEGREAQPVGEVAEWLEGYLDYFSSHSPEHHWLSRALAIVQQADPAPSPPPEAQPGAVREALEKIARSSYGLQGIQEDYGHDVNAYNFHAMQYWEKLAMSFQNIARAALDGRAEG